MDFDPPEHSKSQSSCCYQGQLKKRKTKRLIHHNIRQSRYLRGSIFTLDDGVLVAAALPGGPLEGGLDVVADVVHDDEGEIESFLG